MVLLGTTVLVGWLSGWSRLTTLGPGLASMKPATAGCLVLLAVALVVAARRPLGHTWTERRTEQVLPVVAGLVAAMMLVESVLGVSFGLDDVGGLDASDTAGPPGRMSTATAVGILLLALALLARRWAASTQLLAGGAVAVGAAALAGYLYGVHSLYQVGSFSTVAAHTALGLVLLGVGIMVLDADQGPMSLFVSATAGGVVARRVLPVAVLTPLVGGAVLVRSVHTDWSRGPAAFAFFATVLAAVGGVTVWWQGARLRHVDLERAGALSDAELARRALAERDELAARLTMANADLADFAAAMAHDLRGPLTTIRGYTELLADDASERLDVELLDRMARAATRGAELIDGVLGFVGVGRGEPVPQTVELAGAVRRAWASAHAASPRAATLDVRVTGHVRADPRLLDQLLTNLLANALKYVPGDLDVHVVVDTRDEPGARVVRVGDNGIPIPPSDRERIFEMFQRGEDAGRDSSGSGVGLAICRRIAQLHHGDLTLDPATRGTGNRFSLRLPA